MNVSGIGAKVRAKRKEKGLTQEELGLLAGIATSSVNTIENNTPNPGIQSMLKIAKALDVTIEELVYGKRKPNKIKRRSALIKK